MKAKSSLVTEADSRGRQHGDRCFYCPSTIGSEHGPECVRRQRTIVVRTVVEHTVLVPEFWDEDLINFSRNESSKCADNILDELARVSDYLDHEKQGRLLVPHPDGPAGTMTIVGAPLCFCRAIESTYVREASAEDEFRCGVFAEGREPPKDLKEAQARDAAASTAN